MKRPEIEYTKTVILLLLIDIIISILTGEEIIIRLTGYSIFFIWAFIMEAR